DFSRIYRSARNEFYGAHAAGIVPVNRRTFDWRDLFPFHGARAASNFPHEAQIELGRNAPFGQKLEQNLFVALEEVSEPQQIARNRLRQRHPACPTAGSIADGSRLQHQHGFSPVSTFYISRRRQPRKSSSDNRHIDVLRPRRGLCCERHSTPLRVNNLPRRFSPVLFPLGHSLILMLTG